MILIGMLDSPYVRRVAISLSCLGLSFEHRSISVFSGFAEFERINPVVKAPTLVCDDGTVLMDSTLILDYAQALAGAPAALLPARVDARCQALRLIGLALAACEKTVQLVYEDMLRQPDKRDAAWVGRVSGQLLAAYRELDTELARRSAATALDPLGLAGISVAVAWRFTRMVQATVVDAAQYPALAGFCAAAEARPEYLRWPPD